MYRKCFIYCVILIELFCYRDDEKYRFFIYFCLLRQGDFVSFVGMFSSLQNFIIDVVFFFIKFQVGWG